MRRASRIVVIDEHEHILLFKTHLPKLATPTTKWLTPGGGLEPNESHVDAAIRELYEETGIIAPLLHGPIAQVPGVSRLADGREQPTYAEFFALSVTRFEIDKSNWLEYETTDIHEVRWVSRQELASGVFDFAPMNLLEIMDLALKILRK